MDRRIFVVSDSTGSTADHVLQREVDEADQLFKREAWPVVDLTLKSLEEAAVEVVSLATDLPYHRRSEDLLP